MIHASLLLFFFGTGHFIPAPVRIIQQVQIPINTHMDEDALGEGFDVWSGYYSGQLWHGITTGG
jgi:hypothetical protein